MVVVVMGSSMQTIKMVVDNASKTASVPFIRSVVVVMVDISPRNVGENDLTVYVGTILDPNIGKLVLALLVVIRNLKIVLIVCEDDVDPYFRAVVQEKENKIDFVAKKVDKHLTKNYLQVDFYQIYLLGIDQDEKMEEANQIDVKLTNIDKVSGNVNTIDIEVPEDVSTYYLLDTAKKAIRIGT